MQTEKVYAQPQRGHVSLGGALRRLLFLVPVIVLGLILYLVIRPTTESWSSRRRGAGGRARCLVGNPRSPACASRPSGNGGRAQAGQVSDSSRGRGYSVYHSLYRQRPLCGLLRLLTLNIPSQQVITKDERAWRRLMESCSFWLLTRKRRSSEFRITLLPLPSTPSATLRDVVGGLSLDELPVRTGTDLSSGLPRSSSSRISHWGLHMDSIRLQDIEMPEDLETDHVAASLGGRPREAGHDYKSRGRQDCSRQSCRRCGNHGSKTPGAMKLRTLQTIDGLGAGPSYTVVMFPVELTETLKTLVESLPQRHSGNPAS